MILLYKVAFSSESVSMKSQFCTRRKLPLQNFNMISSRGLLLVLFEVLVKNH